MTTLSEVDAILLSNHNTMLALPYVTEYSGFKGTVYCTEPTQQIGRYVYLLINTCMLESLSIKFQLYISWTATDLSLFSKFDLKKK